MAFKKQTEHSNPIFSKLELLKIEDIRQLQLLFYLYLIVKTKLHQFTFMIILFSVLKFTTLILDWLHLVIFSWRGKIPFNIVLGQLNTKVLGFRICSL